MAENKIKYTHRFLAQIVIEALTPLAVGSGEKGVLTDALVALDSNGLPYIPATSLAGVFRSRFKTLDPKPTDSEEQNLKQKLSPSEKIFGYMKGTDGCGGSQIIFSEAKILDSKGKVIDGMDLTEISNDPLLQHYIDLPIRQHVRLSEKGVASDSGKFDEQVVFAGSRFCFEIEMVSDGSNFTDFESVLINLFDKSFRLGGGSRIGFGEIKVESLKLLDLDLNDGDDLNRYLDKTSALNTDFWNSIKDQKDEFEKRKEQSADLSVYELTLTPEAFFLFGSGFGDDEVDMTPVKAKKVEWSTDDKGMHGKIQENLVLIPASSIKGAIAHRVAFHWNRLNGVFADDLNSEGIANATGTNNPAVRILFGSEGNVNGSGITRGNVIFSDIIKDARPDKIFNHVAIDRFTGGAIEGALFNEKATYGKGQTYHTKIAIDEAAIRKACKAENLKTNDANVSCQMVINALDASISDVCNGMLPLGGRVNKGYGVFKGECNPKPITIKDGNNK